jgi:hypothetical protein
VNIDLFIIASLIELLVDLPENVRDRLVLCHRDSVVAFISFIFFPRTFVPHKVLIGVGWVIRV